MPDVLDRAQRAEASRAARREVILDAARRVFAERGFRGTTIADIAEAAGIALGTIYIYFKSKEDVFAALNQRLIEIIAVSLTSPTGATTVREITERRIASVFDLCRDHRDLVRLVFLNMDRDSAATMRIREAEEGRFKPMIDMLSRARESGMIRDADPFVMTRLVFGLVTVAVYQAFVVSSGEMAERYRDECAAMITAYLTPTAPAA